MPRKVTTDKDEPYIVDEEEFEEQGGTVAICQCGLSSNKPFCDGTHQNCADESEEVVYEYDNDGNRHVVSND